MVAITCNIQADNGPIQYFSDVNLSWWNLQKDGHYTDVILVSGQLQVRVHREILIRVSSFLNSLVPPSCSCETPAITLPRVEEDTLKALVELAYLGRSEMNSKKGMKELECLTEILEVQYEKIHVARVESEDIIAGDVVNTKRKKPEEGNTAEGAVHCKRKKKDKSEHEHTIDVDEYDSSVVIVDDDSIDMDRVQKKVKKVTGLDKEPKEKHPDSYSETSSEEEEKPKRGGARGKAAVFKEESSGSDSSESEDEGTKPKGAATMIDIENLNRVQKKVMDLDKPEPSRREMEEIEKQRAKAHFQKMRAAEEAHNEKMRAAEKVRADIARLALVRKLRKEAEAKRDDMDRDRDDNDLEKDDSDLENDDNDLENDDNDLEKDNDHGDSEEEVESMRRRLEEEIQSMIVQTLVAGTNVLAGNKTRASAKTKYKCTECPYSITSNYNAIWRHVEAKHAKSKNPGFLCHICQEFCKNVKSLMNHRSREHPKSRKL